MVVGTVPGAETLAFHAKLTNGRHGWVVTQIIRAAKELRETAIVPEELRSDRVEQSADGQTVPEIVLIPTTITAADKEIGTVFDGF